MQQWFVTRISGHDVRVQIHEERRTMPKVHGRSNHYGCYDPETRMVHILRVKSNSFIQDTAIHEILVHAVFEAFGLQENLRRRLDLKTSEWMDIEEDIAHVWTPAAYGSGLIRLPKIPKPR